MNSSSSRPISTFDVVLDLIVINSGRLTNAAVSCRRPSFSGRRRPCLEDCLPRNVTSLSFLSVFHSRHKCRISRHYFPSFYNHIGPMSRDGVSTDVLTDYVLQCTNHSPETTRSACTITAPVGRDLKTALFQSSFSTLELCDRLQ